MAADWLDDPRLHRLFSAIERDGDRAYVVGGAVRNTLLELPAGDVDVATTALPDVVSARAAAAGLKPVPTGIEHGTVTVVVEGHPFEVTTLRRDVESHGRHATVAFGRDWSVDAHRRDFTMNALYASLDGVVHDFVGGIADCRAGRVRFIGAASRRIAEDYLRILRFFRFHAAYGRGPIDTEGLAAAIAARDGLAGLSAERIGQEISKLVVATGAPTTVATMSDAGLLQRVLGRVADLGGFARLHRLVGLPGGPRRESDDAAVFLAALAVWTEADGWALAERLRLSNAARDRMAGAIARAPTVDPAGDTATIDRLLEAIGREATRDAVMLAHGRARLSFAATAASLAAAAMRPVPVMPLGGRDLLALGLPRGPGVGALLAELRAAWVADGFRDDRAALTTRAKAAVDRILRDRSNSSRGV
ncbi:MAG: CCA tRNA nucleotidyltransferase [Phyllobacteriaceae bacterium]|nr:CCA tRNA nucleotidyltransferase [Phyllobacteriaceae bacterium]